MTPPFFDLARPARSWKEWVAQPAIELAAHTMVDIS